MDIINKKLNINTLKTNLFKNIAFCIFIIFLFFISINGARAATGFCSTIATTTTIETITNTPCANRTTQTSCTTTPHYNGQGYKSVCGWTNSGGGNTASNVTVSSQPNVVDYNGKAAVFWSAPGASYCAIPGNGHAPATGPNSYFNTPPLKENTTFTVTCYGLNQTFFGTGSVLVQVRTSDRITDTLTQKHATDITDTEAVLTGSLVPGGTNSFGYFRYSVLETPPIFCNDIFGSNMRATNEVNLGSGILPITFQTKINGLAPNTKYYFCAVGSNKKDISYGGVGSFTTKVEKDGSLHVETGNPATKDAYSAYLNGNYNSDVSSKTWFEFRKISKQGTSNQWIKTNERSHNGESNGKLEFLLGGLTPGTTYETRAAIIRVGIAGSYQPIYGAVKTFKTKDVNNVGSGGVIGGGIGYEDPCINVNDPNCNGTGGGGILPITGGPTSSQLPDLVASSVTISSNVVNTPTILYSTIRNQGNGSTLNITPAESIQNINISPVSFLKNLFTSNKVIAATNTTNQVSFFEKGNFYSFFQISTRNPNLYINTIQNTSNNTSTSFIKNFLKTDVAIAANITNEPVLDNTLVDLPFILVKTLNSKSSSVITQNYVFPSVGTYYIRACADKKNRTDTGLIKELYENNNCGAWKALAISNTGSCPTGWTGTPPNCINPGGGGFCPNGWTGVYPNCINPGDGNSCPLGWTGTPPNCVSPPGGGFCPNGWTGVFPNCTPGGTSCPSGWTGVYPNCISPGGGTGGGGSGGSGGGTGGGSSGGSQAYQNPSSLVLGQTATPPPDAVVRYHEGIETVLARQIIANAQLAKEYGYKEGSDLQAFAWYLSHYFATIFGYVGDNGKEIRVGAPDIAAYQIDLSNRILTIYEYYDSKIVNIQKMTPSLRNIYGYEYYFKK